MVSIKQAGIRKVGKRGEKVQRRVKGENKVEREHGRQAILRKAKGVRMWTGGK